MWLLQKLEEESKKALDEQKKVKEESSPKKPAKKVSPKKQSKEATPEPKTKEEESKEDPVEEESKVASDEDSVPESKSKTDDDEDFDAMDAEDDEEDEELEDVEVERGRLSHVRGSEDEEEAEEDEDEEEDIEDAILLENPYFKPGLESIVEYLARPRTITGEMVQEALCEAILRVKFNKRTAEYGVPTAELESIDEFVLEQETPDFPEGRGCCQVRFWRIVCRPQEPRSPGIHPMQVCIGRCW